MGQVILFVYGTLKRGGRNHRLIAGQQFLGAAVTEPRYKVFDLGEHPAMVADAAGGQAVAGELFAVDAACLTMLDAFEEVPDPFARLPVAIEGRADRVEAYFYVRPISPGTPGGDRWPLQA